MTECITPMLVPNDFLTYGGVTCRISRFFDTLHGVAPRNVRRKDREHGQINNNEQTIILPVPGTCYTSVDR